MQGNALLILFATLSMSITIHPPLVLLLGHRRRRPSSSHSRLATIVSHLPPPSIATSTPLPSTVTTPSSAPLPLIPTVLDLLRARHPPHLVVSPCSAIQECLVKNDLTFSNRPALPSLKDLTHDHTAFGVDPYGPLWKSHRRTAHAVLFSPAIIQSLSAGIIHQEVKVMLRSLLKKENGRGVCTLRPKLSEVTMNVMMRAVAGKRCFGEDEDDVTETGRRFRGLVEEFFHVVNGVHVGDYFPFLKWVGAGLWDRRRRKRLERELDELAAELLEEVREQRNKKKGNKSKMKKSATAPTTVVETLVEMQEWEGKETYNENYLKGMVQSLLLSGIPTIIQQLEWTMALLLNHPEAKNNVTSEINTVVGSNRLLSYSDLPDLPYLNSVLKESFRLCPVGPLLLPRESRNECTVGGFYVSAGTMLIPNACAVYRDPEHWVDPTSFKPERFLEAEENKDLETYFPFGMGRRSCPGSGLAMRVMLTALGGLLQCFEWERVGKELVDMTEGQGFDVPMHKPLVAKYRTRHAMLPLLS
ncbi:uncharacterized protein A4U43_C08F8280 [Asparagus officinalis]|nr:uncharacterized protein A4U43_C08F8280 [Asparagus officinalis]